MKKGLSSSPGLFLKYVERSGRALQKAKKRKMERQAEKEAKLSKLDFL